MCTYDRVIGDDRKADAFRSLSCNFKPGGALSKQHGRGIGALHHHHHHKRKEAWLREEKALIKTDRREQPWKPPAPSSPADPSAIPASCSRPPSFLFPPSLPHFLPALSKATTPFNGATHAPHQDRIIHGVIRPPAGRLIDRPYTLSAILWTQIDRVAPKLTHLHPHLSKL